jgi:cell division protein ZapA (FtsZ GTPase activity inhibitor)
MDDAYKTIKVRIMGEEYPIRSDADTDYLNQLARFVEDRIAGIAAERFPPRLKREVMAALLIADELFDEQKKTADMESRIEEMASAIDDVVARDQVSDS